MLKDLISEKGESVYKIAKGSGIPYTTLNELVLEKKSPETCNVRTLARLAAYWNMSLDCLYDGLLKDSREQHLRPEDLLQGRWATADCHHYRFPVVIDSTFPLISRIHPLKQKKADALWRCCRGDRRIRSLYIFGSSANIRCGKSSDLDIAVDPNQELLPPQSRSELSEQIQNACDFDADIVWMDRTISPVLSENIRKGVQLI